jgi:hypothetical protein
MRKVCEHGAMISSATTCARGIAVMLFAILPAIASGGSVRAERCLLPQQGEGPRCRCRRRPLLSSCLWPGVPACGHRTGGVGSNESEQRRGAFGGHNRPRSHLARRDDAPNRYDRQSAFAFLAGSETPVQALLLMRGAALVSVDIADRDCAASLFAAEAEPRADQRGIWASPSAIKNAESPDDILTGIGQFTVVEGKVLSVRQAGATTYLNFERNWTPDFAVTISRRALPHLAGAGIVPKSLENRRIHVRGWVETRTAPRTEVRRARQSEVLGAN